jgi:hypothetical protein
MNPRTPAPPVSQPRRNEPHTPAEQQKLDEKLDQELDRELDDTFPASDPLPWSHEVK